MTHEEHSRPNLYASVHKGLRACMSHALVAVGSLDTGDARDVARVASSVRELSRLCRVHLEDENTFLHPALEARACGVSTRAIEDHTHHLIALDALDARVGALVDAADRAAVGAEQRALYDQLATFVADNLVHMRHEELVHMPALWATHTDEELVGIESALVASIPSDAMSAFMRWIIAAATPDERARMLADMRAHAPTEVFDGAYALAESALSTRDLDKLARALGVAA